MKKALFLLLSFLLSVSLLCACGGKDAEPQNLDGAGNAPTDTAPSDGDAPLAVGSSVTFGAYEQDDNAENGKEAISWRVLAIEGGRMLLLSEKVLDAQAYNTQNTAVTWENASLRAWLKDSFAKEAFSVEEAARIQTVTLSTPDNAAHGTEGGGDTQDTVFLLSAEEVERYLTATEIRRAVPTLYARNRGAWVLDTGYANAWLRSPGSAAGGSYRAMVLHEGGAGAFGEIVDSKEVGVRPAMWVTLP